jgi:sulfur carrier protein ThiS
MANVTISVIPASGSPTSQDVEIKESGASLKEVLAASGRTASNMLLSINGEPIDASKPHLVHVPAGAKLSLTEKARGS